MNSIYRSEERLTNSGTWGASVETFYASEKEKYLRFGNLVQLTHSTLNTDGGSSGMKLHRNLELVNVVLKGSVGFQDSFGGSSTFPENTIQVVSAGKGMYQTEFNAGTVEVEKLQICFLPNTLNSPPFKTKALFDLRKNMNSLVELVSPNNSASLTVRQKAAVLLGQFDANRHIGYSLNNMSVGLFVYVVHGVVTVQNEILRRGDSIGIIDEEQTLLHTAGETTIAVIEVSMND